MLLFYTVGKNTGVFYEIHTQPKTKPSEAVKQWLEYKVLQALKLDCYNNVHAICSGKNICINDNMHIWMIYDAN